MDITDPKAGVSNYGTGGDLSVLFMGGSGYCWDVDLLWMQAVVGVEG